MYYQQAYSGQLKESDFDLVFFTAVQDAALQELHKVQFDLHETDIKGKVSFQRETKTLTK